jgi:hypothetical protein
LPAWRAAPQTRPLDAKSHLQLKNAMNTSTAMQKAVFFAITLVAAASALTALPVQAANMSRTDYTASKSRIGEAFKADKSACSSQSGNAKDICVEEAKAKEKVARAELEYGYTGKAKDQSKVAVAKAESAYAVAKEKCDDQSGNNKDVCVKAAKALEVRGLADAKMGKQITEAQTDAAQSKRDADYKLAAEKCEAMAGDVKTACMNAAKSRFGKT